VLRGRVLLHELHQLVDEGLAETRHALVVGPTEAHRELVGNEDSVARDHCRLGVEFAAKGARDLDGLQTTLEGLGECAVDGALKTPLEVVQKSQDTPSVLAVPTIRC
jgi:hypothetical protein